jgi:hypothetical protein
VQAKKLLNRSRFTYPGRPFKDHAPSMSPKSDLQRVVFGRLNECVSRDAVDLEYFFEIWRRHWNLSRPSLVDVGPYYICRDTHSTRVKLSFCSSEVIAAIRASFLLNYLIRGVLWLSLALRDCVGCRSYGLPAFVWDVVHFEAGAVGVFAD